MIDVRHGWPVTPARRALDCAYVTLHYQMSAVSEVDPMITARALHLFEDVTNNSLDLALTKP